MIVIAAFRVKSSITKRAMIIAGLVLDDSHLLLTDATQNCSSFIFSFFPNFSFMASFFSMAIIARVISIAAFELDGDYIQS